MDELIQVLKRIEDNQKQILDFMATRDKNYLTVEESAKYLGISLTQMKGMLRSRVGKGPEISFYMATSRMRYISREDLDKWITKNKFLSDEEIQRKGCYTKSNL